MSDQKPIYMTRTEGNWKFIIMMFAFILLAFVLQTAQHSRDILIEKQNNVLVQQAVDRQTDAAVQEQILKAQNIACIDRVKAAEGTNEILSTLISAVSATNSIKEPEKSQRVKKYRSVMIRIPVCSNGLK